MIKETPGKLGTDLGIYLSHILGEEEKSFRDLAIMARKFVETFDTSLDLNDKDVYEEFFTGVGYGYSRSREAF